MKIRYNKKGITLIGFAFFLSVLINMWIENNYSFFIIPFTIGVLFPYFVIAITSFFFYLFKNREIYIYSDSRIVILFAILELIIIYGHIISND